VREPSRNRAEQRHEDESPESPDAGLGFRGLAFLALGADERTDEERGAEVANRGEVESVVHGLIPVPAMAKELSSPHRRPPLIASAEQHLLRPLDPTRATDAAAGRFAAFALGIGHYLGVIWVIFEPWIPIPAISPFWSKTTA